MKLPGVEKVQDQLDDLCFFDVYNLLCSHGVGFLKAKRGTVNCEQGQQVCATNLPMWHNGVHYGMLSCALISGRQFNLYIHIQHDAMRWKFISNRLILEWKPWFIMHARSCTQVLRQLVPCSTVSKRGLRPNVHNATSITLTLAMWSFHSQTHLTACRPKSTFWLIFTDVNMRVRCNAVRFLRVSASLRAAFPHLKFDLWPDASCLFLWYADQRSAQRSVTVSPERALRLSRQYLGCPHPLSACLTRHQQQQRAERRAAPVTPTRSAALHYIDSI